MNGLLCVCLLIICVVPTGVRTGFREIIAQSRAQYGLIAEQIAQIEAGSSESETECSRVLAFALRNSIHYEWISKMIASSGLLHSDALTSIVNGQYSLLGNFDECLSLTNVTVAEVSSNFNAKYCLVGFQVRESPSSLGDAYAEKRFHQWTSISERFPIMSSICVPSVCSQAKLEFLLNAYFEVYLNESQLKVDYCQTAGETVEKTLAFSLSLYLLGLVVITSCLSTFWLNLVNGNAFQVLKCFDICENVRSVFGEQEPTVAHTLDLRFLHGLKALLLFFTVAIHSVSRINVALLSHISTLENYPWNYLQLEADPIVSRVEERNSFFLSTFFSISGFTSAYLLLSAQKQNTQSSIFIIVTRYSALLPSVLATIGLTIVAQHLGSGPLFHPSLTDPYVRPCETYCWTHLLMIHNFWTMDKMCGINMWFIATNFQFFIVLVFSVGLLKERPHLAKLCLTLASCISLVPFILVFLQWSKLTHGFAFYKYDIPDQYDALRLLYTMPLLYAAPYFLGALLAIYVLQGDLTVHLKDSLFSKLHLCTLVYLVTFQLAHFLPLPIIAREGEPASDSTTVLGLLPLYLLFCLNTLFWLYSLLVSKPESAIKRFLSSRFFFPFGRLSMGIYLLNLIVIWANVHQARVTPSLQPFSLFQAILSDYVQAFLLALFMAVFIELPSKHLLKLCLVKQAQPTNTSTE